MKVVTRLREYSGS